MEALEWLGQSWDDDAAMLWNPPGSFDDLFPPSSVHVVPPTVWYALGLLMRGGDHDVARAQRAIHAVIGCQINEPGAPWHGTYPRFREFPHPQPGAVEFVGYDPNWRQFVGTGFALMLRLAPKSIAGPTADAMVASMRLAVDGEPPDRVAASYSNIALMRAWLDVDAGHRFDRPDLVARGEELAERIVARFDLHGAFDEWNSPTYYGVDLYALALWRSHSESPNLQAWGARLEQALWADLAPWYHAGLANVAGPYSRAYGMDMRRYVGAVGLWIDAACGADPRPVPDLDRPFRHAHDLSLAPVVAALGSTPLATEHFERFQGERVLERVVSSRPERVATAWLGPNAMVGAETGTRTWSAQAQYHPATVHWRAPDGSTRWIRLVHAGPVRAAASTQALKAVCAPHRHRGAQPTRFLISAADKLTTDRWELPGLTVHVETNAGAASISEEGPLQVVTYEARTSGSSTFELTLDTDC